MRVFQRQRGQGEEAESLHKRTQDFTNTLQQRENPRKGNSQEDGSGDQQQDTPPPPLFPKLTVKADVKISIEVSFGNPNATGAGAVNFGQALSAKLLASTALQFDGFDLGKIDLGKIVTTMTASIFQQMQPKLAVASPQVPSSFAAACPCGGARETVADPTTSDLPFDDLDLGFDALHMPVKSKGVGARNTDLDRMGKGAAFDQGPSAGGGMGDNQIIPHETPTARDIAAYRPGGGCPVMDRHLEKKKDGKQGSADSHDGNPLRRLFEADYEDDTGSMAGSHRPSAREISNAVNAAQGNKPAQNGATDLFWGWGQFLDHDLSISEGSKDDLHAIPIPLGDPRFDPDGTGTQTLDFHRSPGLIDENGVRQQMNNITPAIDGSNVYGSSQAEQNALRCFQGGKLELDAKGNLPRNQDGFFVAGDARVNENPLLASFHTVFAREHNRLADEIASKHPDWTDQQIFEAARCINVAQIQSITSNEFLPMLLGDDAIGSYEGHQEGLDIEMSNAFTTSAFRFGHTMVSDELKLVDECGHSSGVSLDDAFFNTSTIDDNGIDDVFRGAADQVAQEMDTELVDGLRNHVLTGPGELRLDLASLNIQRGRDHGLPSLNEMKRQLGQTPLSGFDDPRLRDGAGARLAEIYTSIEDVDPWVGMLAERPIDGGMAGETQAAVLSEQFKRTRDGDPNWYENTFSAERVAEINNTTLADIIERNINDIDVQDYAMLSERHQPGLV